MKWTYPKFQWIYFYTLILISPAFSLDIHSVLASDRSLSFLFPKQVRLPLSLPWITFTVPFNDSHQNIVLWLCLSDPLEDILVPHIVNLQLKMEFLKEECHRNILSCLNGYVPVPEPTSMASGKTPTCGAGSILLKPRGWLRIEQT